MFPRGNSDENSHEVPEGKYRPGDVLKDSYPRYTVTSFREHGSSRSNGRSHTSVKTTRSAIFFFFK